MSRLSLKKLFYTFLHAGYTVLTIDIPPTEEVVVIEDTGRQLGGKRSPYSAPLPPNSHKPGYPGTTAAHPSPALDRFSQG